ncbi:chromate transporter [Alkalibacter rhizosphaerae]|uniref:Chromate transporter n=1 Tax=Alkalibacter rhizosphaerae TaxID=2815577 RepID=A0A974XGL8_9FIRM|nr:chromate transporter [Alkalibacter rhizosphaerae]QSX09321.1 chromate transporter [Alkalibacter rhizosphaerae]
MGIIWEVFVVFFKIGMFTFGGGYAMIPIMQREIIQVQGWMKTAEFLDIVGIAEMTPGVIAVNMATFLGYRLSGGVPGALFATLAVILPSSVIVFTISYFFQRFRNSLYVRRALEFIRPVVIGLIASAGFLLFREAVMDVAGVFIVLGAFYLSAFRKVNPILILLGMGLVGFVIYSGVIF